MGRNLSTGVHGLIGSRNYAKHPRVEHDFYSTGDGAISRLEYVYPLPHSVWEPACGDGALVRQLEAEGHEVYSTDLVDRGFGTSGVDFLSQDTLPPGVEAIVTNPPYNVGVDFVLRALQLMEGRKGVVAMFLKTQFLESQTRYDSIFRHTPPPLRFSVRKTHKMLSKRH